MYKVIYTECHSAKIKFMLICNNNSLHFISRYLKLGSPQIRLKHKSRDKYFRVRGLFGKQSQETLERGCIVIWAGREADVDCINEKVIAVGNWVSPHWGPLRDL